MKNNPDLQRSLSALSIPELLELMTESAKRNAEIVELLEKEIEQRLMEEAE